MKTSASTRLATIVASCLLAAGATGASDPRPNIVVILVDDMGYSDIGCYGGEIRTPNLDRLARDGVRFTQFHNTARCCPTRAALLTGLYPHQAGVGHMTEEQRDSSGQPLAGYSGRLNNRCVTIAEALKAAGYFTAMTGKWHVGQNHGVTPWDRGFDRTLTAAAGGFYFPDSPRAALFLNGKDLGSRGAPLPREWYSTDLWIEYGLKFIDEARAAQQPFFLYVAHNAPHFPLQAPAEDIARWRGKFKAGWDVLRRERYARQLEMGLIDKAWPLSPRPDAVPAWTSLSAEDQDRYDHIMAIYAAVVERMDRSIGTLVSGLRDRGELDNTLILFMSDNGGNAESGVRGRLEGSQPGDALSTVFVGECWAALNNTPFVRYKHFTDEGGIATPLIAHWPRGISASRNGALESQPGHVIDIMPTCLDVAGTSYPDAFKGRSVTPLEGVSLRPGFEGRPLGRARPLFWEHEGNRAVLDGKWKLVALAGQAWRLYDTVKDRTEENDLAASEPDRVKALAAKWDEYAARANVLPLGGWRSSARNTRGNRAPDLSKEAQFALKMGDRLDRAHAPAIAGRPFTITAAFDSDDPQGVIVAQGGTARGYALFVENGKLVFLVRTAGGVTQVSAPQLVKGAHTAVARLDRGGGLSLALDGKPAASGQAPSLVATMPVDGLEVGSDQAGLVGPYSNDNQFRGRIESVRIVLD
ncbi:MAG TPA: arylsulfatase [Verrucomicrobiota bacterium]|nr:arylsulfatase [Verrucomicrobiota bacterium]HRZ56797.1 arylsulfatase [Candidatus Paceibacterota bacterium]